MCAFRLSALYIISIMEVWMPTKKNILAFVYVGITFIMSFGVQHSERVTVCEEFENVQDKYAISVLRGEDVVRHLFQKNSRIDTSSSWNIM